MKGQIPQRLGYPDSFGRPDLVDVIEKLNEIIEYLENEKEN